MRSFGVRQPSLPRVGVHPHEGQLGLLGSRPNNSSRGAWSCQARAMAITDLLGRTVTLTVLRTTGVGVFLGADPADADDVVLLPTREVPEEVQPGDELEVFVYLDSADRPIATTRRPMLERGEVRFLRVSEINRVGAFVDWGMPKELLVPFAEQTVELAPGQMHAIGLLLDRSDRLCGTMRVRELLFTGGNFERDEIVEGEAWREEPGIGVFCILEQRFVGLLPDSEPHSLRRGERTTFRIKHVQADGKLELSLRGHGHEEIDSDAERVLSVLTRGALPEISDRSSPEQIRQQFGLSKKAFKRAVGRLLKEGAVQLDRQGFIRRSV